MAGDLAPVPFRHFRKGKVMAAEPLVVLTGAGISKESGLDTFRDTGGIWNRYKVEDVATPEGYRRNPSKLYAFYNELRGQLAPGKAQPNAAHRALARLEETWPGEVTIITQNIDDLHERAGSRRVIHMHGELTKARCEACEKVFACETDFAAGAVCPACAAKGRIRPHIVWFGEVPLDMPRIFERLDRCGLFLSIGTSGNVYPAAGFVSHLRSRGHARTVELNLEPSLGATLFHETIYGPASLVVPDFVETLLRGV